jgi:hypothetical protein
MKKYYICLLALLIFCAAAVASNTILRRGPLHDNQVSTDLDSINTAISGYATSHSSLPPSLSAVSVTDDPGVSGRLSAYTYQPGNGAQYKLCATFATASPTGQTSNGSPGSPDTTIHGQGYVCFSYTDPSLTTSN